MLNFDFLVFGNRTQSKLLFTSYINNNQVTKPNAYFTVGRKNIDKKTTIDTLFPIKQGKFLSIEQSRAEFY